MGSTPDSILDTARIKAHWTGKASAWAGWADTMAAMADRFNRPMLEAIGVDRGCKLLDLASGAGEPALTAAEMSGPDGTVVATDFVPDMLTGIRRRDVSGRLLLAAADMQHLPFPDVCFDRVSCRFGIMFVPDPAPAAAETRRVLRAGGRAGFLVWGPRTDQTMFTILGDAVAEITGEELDAHHLQIFRFGPSGTLGSLLRDAGFTDVVEQPLHFTPTAPADRPFWRPQLDMSFGHLLGTEDTALRRRVEDRIREKLEPLRTDDGTGYRMQAHIRLAVGHRL